MKNGALPVLEVRGLSTRFSTRSGRFLAVDEVDLRVGRGEVLALVGESGSGKSITGLSIFGLVDAPGEIVAGSVRLLGRELRALDAEALRRLRGRDMAMIFQDPMMTLNPVLRIDTQMVEAIQAHERIGRAAARERARAALERVGMAAAAQRLRAYPHQLSGGMRQRVAIATAFLHSPALIIADEPTTALDVSIQAQIVVEMQKLCSEAGTALLWISHDLAVVAGLADRVCVMYAGRIVEEGSTTQVLATPAHPYTHGLLKSTPAAATPGQPLPTIPGLAPAATERPAGCAFRPRCERASELCLQVPAVTELGDAHRVRCFHPLPPAA